MSNDLNLPDNLILKDINARGADDFVAATDELYYELEVSLELALATCFYQYFYENPEAVLFISGAYGEDHEKDSSHPNGIIYYRSLVARVDKKHVHEIGATCLKLSQSHQRQTGMNLLSYEKDALLFRMPKINNHTSSKDFLALPQNVDLTTLSIELFEPFYGNKMLLIQWSKLAKFYEGSDSNKNGMVYGKEHLPEILNILGFNEFGFNDAQIKHQVERYNLKKLATTDQQENQNKPVAL